MTDGLLEAVVRDPHLLEGMNDAKIGEALALMQRDPKVIGHRRGGPHPSHSILT